MTVHAVLGAGGVIGRETVAALRRRHARVISVGRSAGASDADVESRRADLLDPEATRRAVRGADVVHLVAGLPYSSAVWERDWPVIVRNAVAAADAADARLVAFDNVYAYGRVTGPMTEDAPLRPVSRKGAVRARARELLSGLPGVAVAVAADFYGPGARTSVFNRFAVDPLRRGRRGAWLFDASLPHSMTYTPDIGEALAVLGESPEHGVWHLPTAPALTGAEYVEAAGGAPGRTRVIGRGLLRLAAVASVEARETLEMAYQYEAPYLFDSGRFERRFGPAPTPYATGIRRSAQAAADS